MGFKMIIDRQAIKNVQINALNYVKCCVFQPTFGCCAHPKAGRSSFFQPFSTFFVHFKPFSATKNIKMSKYTTVKLLNRISKLLWQRTWSFTAAMKSATFLSLLKSCIRLSSMMGSSPQNMSKQKPSGGPYPLYNAPVKSQEDSPSESLPLGKVNLMNCSNYLKKTITIVEINCK